VVLSFLPEIKNISDLLPTCPLPREITEDHSRLISPLGTGISRVLFFMIGDNEENPQSISKNTNKTGGFKASRGKKSVPPTTITRQGN